MILRLRLLKFTLDVADEVLKGSLGARVLLLFEQLGSSRESFFIGRCDWGSALIH